MKAVMSVVAMLALGGCASNGQTPWQALTATASCARLSDDQQLSLSMADDMAAEGRLHASLANLQRLPENLAQVRLSKAKALRQLGRSEAEPLYRSLLGTCLGAEGEHGLGQLAMVRGDDSGALEHLRRAARLSPTDEKIRNDLGVVFLNQKRLQEARFEFLTAMELKPSDTLAASNLVTLLIYQDNWKQASELVTRAGLSPEQVADAQSRAEQLKKPERAVPTASSDRVAGLDSTAGDVK
ncbi:tetratricopeptide repeat protein [Pseudomonas sp. R5(2019)]|uniref:tetratricopeptide repeat protein n=1 Tax=Pseudomonas sp. R5(2019) TaxID=2697566 RepID=UPI001411B89B|nr:tetratricopeptide repeat protein [Pseudomonas sp. R5(2019)]NBA95073.1 tetratricopeptide repeat protein [Pseudomonas sp. R5(2019)]